MPMRLFGLARTEGAEASAIALGDLLVDFAATIDRSTADLSDLVFFKVVRVHSTRREFVRQLHIPAASSSAVQVLFAECHVDDDGNPLVDFSRSVLVDLEVRAWCDPTTFVGFVQGLRRWTSSGDELSLAMTGAERRALRSIDDMLPPSLSILDLTDDTMSAELLQGARSTDDRGIFDQCQQVLGVLQGLQAFGGVNCTWVSAVELLEHADSRMLLHMRDKGIVRSKHDEFSELHVAFSSDRLVWEAKARLTRSVLDLDCCAPSMTTQLIQAWQDGEALLGVSGGDEPFAQMLAH